MSDIGLYSGLYETIRRWADLIDDLLVELRSGVDVSTSRTLEEFRKLVSGLASDDEESIDFSDQRVAAIVEISLDNKMLWHDLLDKLNTPTLSSATIPTLESVAQCLAAKHADTVAKMRRGRP